VIGSKVGVIGHGEGGAEASLFLRTYTPEVTLFSLGSPLRLGVEHQRLMDEAGIVAVMSPVRDVATKGDQGRSSAHHHGRGLHTQLRLPLLGAG
jgi:thioredoxin reductase